MAESQKKPSFCLEDITDNDKLLNLILACQTIWLLKFCSNPLEMQLIS